MFPSSFTQDGLGVQNYPQGNISFSVGSLEAPPQGLFGSLEYPDKASQYNISGVSLSETGLDVQDSPQNDYIGELVFTPATHSKNNVNVYPVTSGDESLLMLYDEGISNPNYSAHDTAFGTILQNLEQSDLSTSPEIKVLHKISNVYPSGWVEVTANPSVTRTKIDDPSEPDLQPNVQLWWDYLETYGGPSLNPLPPLPSSLTIFGQSLAANTVLVVQDEDVNRDYVALGDVNTDGIRMRGGTSTLEYLLPLIGQGDPSVVDNDPIYIDTITYNQEDWSWEIRFWDAVEETSGVYVKGNKYIVVFSSLRITYPLI